MAKVEVKNLKNEVTKDITLNKDVFGVEVNDIVLKKEIDLQLAASRQGTAKTKTRSEVSGGGRKPWRQKGTGRARQGSTRATQWVGGGIAGGVQPRNYAFKINKKERVLALKSALTHKANDKEIVVVDSLTVKSMKTKDIKAMVEAMKLNGKILFVAATTSDVENLYMATRNLGYAYVLMADELNCYDLSNADLLVVEEEAIKQIEEVLK